MLTVGDVRAGDPLVGPAQSSVDAADVTEFGVATTRCSLARGLAEAVALDFPKAECSTPECESESRASTLKIGRPMVVATRSS